MTALASCNTSLVRQSKTVEQFRKRVFIEFVSFNNKVHESVVHKYSNLQSLIKSYTSVESAGQKVLKKIELSLILILNVL